MLRARASVSCPAFCQPRVPGSTRFSPGGCMASAPWWNLTGCFLHSNWLSACVPILAVRMNLILLFPKRSRDYALVKEHCGTGYSYLLFPLHLLSLQSYSIVLNVKMS